MTGDNSRSRRLSWFHSVRLSILLDSEEDIRISYNHLMHPHSIWPIAFATSHWSVSISCKKSRFFKASSAGFGSMVGSYASPIISNRLGPKVSCGVLVPALLFTSYLLLAFASHLVMVLVARVVMGFGMGMARTLCPSYIQDVVHPRNSWLETCLPPTLAAAGILLGQVGTFLQYHYLMSPLCTDFGY